MIIRLIRLFHWESIIIFPNNIIFMMNEYIQISYLHRSLPIQVRDLIYWIYYKISEADLTNRSTDFFFIVDHWIKLSFEFRLQLNDKASGLKWTVSPSILVSHLPSSGTTVDVLSSSMKGNSEKRGGNEPETNSSPLTTCPR